MCLIVLLGILISTSHGNVLTFIPADLSVYGSDKINPMVAHRDYTAASNVRKECDGCITAAVTGVPGKFVRFSVA